jgi:sugar phosphate isomerase/epimerase
MIIGTRVVHAEEVTRWDAELLQISVYRFWEDSINVMKQTASACRDVNIPYVIHPVGYTVMNEETFGDITMMARLSDRALILHDERTSEGERIDGDHAEEFRKRIETLQAHAYISFENATDTGDVKWFWNKFAGSITLDIGHVESSGRNSLEFVRSLDASFVNKIEYVHMHRNNGLRGGLTDHWPLTAECREYRALDTLIKIKPEISVILEINELDDVADSLNLLRNLR